MRIPAVFALLLAVAGCAEPSAWESVPGQAAKAAYANGMSRRDIGTQMITACAIGDPMGDECRVAWQIESYRCVNEAAWDACNWRAMHQSRVYQSYASSLPPDPIQVYVTYQ